MKKECVQKSNNRFKEKYVCKQINETHITGKCSINEIRTDTHIAIMIIHY